jgi:hypothetical protein
VIASNSRDPLEARIAHHRAGDNARAKAQYKRALADETACALTRSSLDATRDNPGTETATPWRRGLRGHRRSAIPPSMSSARAIRRPGPCL